MAKRGDISSGNEIGMAARTVLLLGAVAMAVILLIGGIYLVHFGREEPEPEQPEADLVKDFAELIASASEDSFEYEEVELPNMTLEEAFSFYSEDTSYYHEVTVSISGTDGSKLERIKRILRDGDKYNITTYNKNTLIETIKCDGETIFVINEITGETNKIPQNEDNSPLELASMPSHENIYGLLEEYRKKENADSSVLSECNYSLLRSRDMNLLELNVKYRDTGMKEKYLYYLNYGVIYLCYSEAESGIQPYNMTTTYFNPDISDFVDEDSFSTR